MGECPILAPIAEAGTVARALDMFAMFGVGVIIAGCFAAVVVLYFIFRIEQVDE
jgi:hypothetical protein